MSFKLSIKAPSHSTILLWVKKYGHYRLTVEHGKSDDWVIILDESVQFGQNRLLFICGIRQSQIDFSRPLGYQDLVPLSLISRSSWKGEDIKEQIEKIEERIGKICYAVADHGNPIKKAIRLVGIPHIYDITHCISLILEHIYLEDADFKGYTKSLAHLRATQPLGKMSHVLPPAQRVSARFMNLKPLSDWGIAVLGLLDRGTKDFEAERENLKWVDGYRALILELSELNHIINEIQLIIKTKGLSSETAKDCLTVLEKVSNDRLVRFKNKMAQYLMDTLNDAKGFDRILCSSDIIESSFGKYKNYLQSNPMVGITNLSLSLAAFTGNLSAEEILGACQSSHVGNINEWTALNLGKTTLSKRLEVLKMERS